MSNDDLERVRKLIKAVPDFPEKGILFQDIFPIFKDPKAFEILIDHILNHIKNDLSEKVDVIVGLDARGFLFGPLIAYKLNVPFVPCRKKGKLPGNIITAEFVKEYGVDTFEMQSDSIEKDKNVIVLDDLLATGGTANAAGQLVKKFNAKVLEYIFIIELVELNGKKNLDSDVYSIYKFT
ncbi:13221_t:CDS:2 [Entrophospora sp. SA101]|nr:12620_t:CDS:2 [Entrophospora sp. SA101]CAJ0745072.1 13221_t:CDS:2 [Entrophospora sp. SA101]CAJ0826083.1 8692_t:CDS:2 [Entrophospora sp. SA101]CAJ0843027.1 16716_t:CDS:2 [Entrophospora sp. SA101]